MVDDYLLQHEAVEEACTIGIPNEEWGEEVRSVIQLRPGYEPGDDLSTDIITWARKGLGKYKCPRSIAWSDELPRLPSGKILRRKVREPYWQDRERQI